MFFLQTNTQEIKDVNSLLFWVIGTLLTFITALYFYFKSEIKEKRDELKEERNYNRTQDQNNIKLITDVNNVLRANSKVLENLQIDISKEVSPIVKDNNTKIQEIKNHLSNGG